MSSRSSSPSLSARSASLALEALEPRVLLADFQALVNFQPSGSAAPPGYLVDSGAVFGNRGNGFTYGWNLDNSDNARDRNNSTSPDQRYDTFTHTQLYGTRTWEIAVPSGQYIVHMVAGDPSYTNSVYRISAEGAVVVDGTPTSASPWVEGTVTVSVTDGRLTLDNAAGADNNKFAFVDITQVPSVQQPSVASISPVNGASGVDVDTNITATLSLPNGALDPSTVNATTVKLIRDTDQAQVTAAVSIGGGGGSIIIDPSSSLLAGTSYHVNLSSGIKDVAGQSLVAFSSSFTTLLQGDYMPPADPRITVDLESSWKFKRSDVSGAQSPSYNDSTWGTVNLPHTWNNLDGQDGGNDYYRGIGWYRKSYFVPTSLTGKEIFIKFDGANTITDLYVNGTFVGQHEGGFSAFTWDLTDYLNVGSSNLIAVKVNNAFDADVAPLQGPDVIQEGADFTLFGGIYRDVSLIATDPSHVTLTDFSSPGVYLTQDNVSAASADLQVRTKVRNDGSASRLLTVVADVVDADGVLVRRLTQTKTVGASQTLDFVQDTTIASPHLWDGTADPYLYTVFVQVKDGTATTDVVQQPLGFRFFNVDPANGFFLNGHYLDLHGVNFHQDRINKGWAISDADQVEDLNLIREVGANFVRLSHYQHPEKTYDLLDQYGIGAWSEIPFIYDATDSTAFFNNMKQQLQEMIRQNYNHPSVLFWGLFNGVEPEPETLALLPQLVSLAHTEDPSRPTTGATVSRVAQDSDVNFFTDAVSINDYWGWYRGTFSDFGDWVDQFHKDFPNQPIGVSEFGAGASTLDHQENPPLPDTGGSFHPEEYQNKFFEAQWAQMVQRPYLWEKTVFNMFDFAVDERDEGDIAGRNDKGLVTYDRQTKKDSFYFFKANWSDEPVTYITSRRYVDRPTSTVEVKVYSNAASVQILVNGVSLGSKTSGDHIFKWTGVQLKPGANTIEAIGTKAGQTYHDAVVWNAPSGSNGLLATYFNNIDLTGGTVTRVDPNINFDWKKGSPDPAIGADTFSARWVGQVQPAYSQTYTFYATVNDGVRLWINGVKIVDHWANGGTTEYRGSISLQAGVKYDLVMEFFENTSNAVAKLSWSSASQSKQIIPSTRLFTNLAADTTVADASAGSGDSLSFDTAAALASADSSSTAGTTSSLISTNWNIKPAASGLWSQTEMSLLSRDPNDLLARPDSHNGTAA